MAGPDPSSRRWRCHGADRARAPPGLAELPLAPPAALARDPSDWPANGHPPLTDRTTPPAAPRRSVPFKCPSATTVRFRVRGGLRAAAGPRRPQRRSVRSTPLPNRTASCADLFVQRQPGPGGGPGGEAVCGGRAGCPGRGQGALPAEEGAPRWQGPRAPRRMGAPDRPEAGPGPCPLDSHSG